MVLKTCKNNISLDTTRHENGIKNTLFWNRKRRRQKTD